MDKAALRKKLLAARQKVAAPRRESMSAALVAHLKEWLETQDPDVVALYHPVRGEPDVTELVVALPHLPFVLPVVGEEPGVMTFHAYRRGDPLTRSRLGILEPDRASPHVTLTPRSIVIVPSVALDLRGARLGYGGGYYDRLLAGFPGTAVGVVFRSMMVDNLPVQPHDVHLAYVATEQGVVRSES